MNASSDPLNSILYEKALGAYLGFACGDALGATVEFMAPEQIQNRYGIHKDIIGGGWLRLQPGDVTDDTEMAITLGQAIIESKGWDISSVADHFVSWLHSHPPDIGETCLRGIRRYKNTGELHGPVNEKEAGNGACMRVLPVALATLFSEESFNNWTIQQCHLTHHNPVSDQATLVMGRIAQSLILEQNEHVQTEIEHLLSIYPEFQFHPYPQKTSGYIIDTVQSVLHFYETTDNFEDCLVRAVNMGGDADTIGAIAGMLAGAKYGVKAIPERWLNTLNTEVVHHIKHQTEALLQLAYDINEEKVMV